MNFDKALELLALGSVVVELVLYHVPRVSDPGNVHSKVNDVERHQSVKPKFPTAVRM